MARIIGNGTLLTTVVIYMVMAICNQAAAAPVFIEWKVSEGGNGHFYALTENASSWDQAQTTATAFGGNLATINDATENQWVLDTFAQPSNIWIGFYQDLLDPDYSEPGGAWKWISGEAVTYTNWISGEPNDNGSEHWAQMKGSGSVWDGQWNDVGNPSMLRGVIEVPEPATLSLLLFGGLVALKRRR